MFETLNAAAQTSEVLQSEALIPFLRFQINGIRDVLLLICGVFAIIIVIIAMIAAKGAIGKILVGICTAALFIWGVHSLGANDKPKELIDEQVDYRGAAGLMDHVNS